MTFTTWPHQTDLGSHSIHFSDGSLSIVSYIPFHDRYLAVEHIVLEIARLHLVFLAALLGVVQRAGGTRDRTIVRL